MGITDSVAKWITGVLGAGAHAADEELKSSARDAGRGAVRAATGTAREFGEFAKKDVAASIKRAEKKGRRKETGRKAKRNGQPKRGGQQK